MQWPLSIHPEALLLDEGILLSGPVLDTLRTAADPEAALSALCQQPERLLGLTASGCTFRCIPEIIHTEARGHRTPLQGALLISGYQVSLSGTLTEVSPENVARLLNTAPMDALCWVGRMGRGLLGIELSAPISLSGLTIEAPKRGMSTMPFCFSAQQTSPDEALPCQFVWLKEADA